MGKFVNNVDEFYKFCEENEVAYVDFRFTDIKGRWHHISYRMDAVEASMLEAGLPFDGSSIENWQPIEKFLSQMFQQHFLTLLQQTAPLLLSVMYMISIKMNFMKDVHVLLLKKH